MNTTRHPNRKSIHAQHDPRLDRRQKEIMKGGNASRAESIVTDCMIRLRVHFHTIAPEIYVTRARTGLMPVIETCTVKRGGASYQVPQPIHINRRESLAVRWLVEASRRRLKKDKTHGMGEALALEVISVIQDIAACNANTAKGATTLPTLQTHSMNKLVGVHRVAKANRVFSHRRWH